jgi:hypothetical protein
MTEPIRSSQSGLPGLIRKKNPGTNNSGTGSILSSIRRGQLAPGGDVPGSSTNPTIQKAGSLTGTIRKAVQETISDSSPVTARKKLSPKDETVTAPVSYETGGILASLKSGLVSFLPAILVIGAVVIGVVIIKSAGSK